MRLSAGRYAPVGAFPTMVLVYPLFVGRRNLRCSVRYSFENILLTQYAVCVIIVNVNR